MSLITTQAEWVRRGAVRALGISAMLALSLAGRSADAVLVGTGALHVECVVGSVCCADFNFASTTYDVFGTPIDMGSGVGIARSTNIAILGFNGTSGMYSATAEALTPGLFGYDTAGSFLCAVDGCGSGVNTFVGDVDNLSGSFTLPGGLTYTLDGSNSFTMNLPGATIPGCPAGGVDVTTTASVTGPIEICSQYPDANDDGIVDGTGINEASLRFLHEEAGVFVDRTSSADPVANRICAQVSSLSFFIVAVDLDAATCPPAPLPSCRGAAKSLLLLKNDPSDDAKDKLTWKWLNGGETSLDDLGSPTTTTGYTLCC